MNKVIYIWVAIALGVLGMVFWMSMGGREVDWEATYSRKDKDPFGCYVTYKLLPDVTGHEVAPVRQTIRGMVRSKRTFEELTSDEEEAPQETTTEEEDDVAGYIQSLIDSNKQRQHELNREAGNEAFLQSPFADVLPPPDEFAPAYSFVFIDEYVHLNTPDAEALLQHLNNGNTALIAATEFNIELSGLSGINAVKRSLSSSDSTRLRFLPGTRPEIPFKRRTVNYYLQYPEQLPYEVIAVNDGGQPVLIDLPVGKGHLLLSSTPKVFTNYHIIKPFSEPYAAKVLAKLRKAPAFWCGKYTTDEPSGNAPPEREKDDRSLLYFIHSQPPLTWAFYLALTTLLLFVLLEAKRRQRVIPEKRPVQNSTLDFIASISRLYFLRGEHKDIAQKKIRYFNEYIRSYYYLLPAPPMEVFYTRLSEKSGVSEEFIERLYTFIGLLKDKKSVSREELIELNALTEQFKSESYN